MVNVRPQRKLAAKVLNVGVNRVWIDPNSLDDVALALTREDIREKVSEGKIKKRRVKGISRGRARVLHKKKQRGQRYGPGSRKGTANARYPRKREWVNKIRAQRELLRELRDGGYITPHTYRILYRQAKGGMFRSVRYLKNYIRERGLTVKRLPE